MEGLETTQLDLISPQAFPALENWQLSKRHDPQMPEYRKSKRSKERGRCHTMTVVCPTKEKCGSFNPALGSANEMVWEK